MVVQPAQAAQFFHPSVETGDAGCAIGGTREAGGEGAIPCKFGLQGNPIGVEPIKHGRPQFKPALPIGPPGHFLDKLLSRCRAVLAQDRRNDLFLGDHAPPQPGRKGRDVRPVLRPQIKVAPIGIGAPRGRDKFGQASQAGGAGGDPFHPPPLGAGWRDRQPGLWTGGVIPTRSCRAALTYSHRPRG